jgi:ATP-dependent Lhr-like helicase
MPGPQRGSAPDEALEAFGPLTRAWFRASFERPTPAQAQAWRAIATGADTLVVAPTGSGKTLAAFLAAIDGLAHRTPQGPTTTSVVYISPLKALGVDVERNLRSPLVGLAQQARLLDRPAPSITVGVRTGDTDSAARRALAARPPDILITTPESLYLMLTSAARTTLTDVGTVIVDEIHALAGTKRGAHLALSLERLEHLAAQRPQRIGLSATVKPAETVASFLSGPAPVATVLAPADKRIEVAVDVPVPDLADLAGAAGPGDDEAAAGAAPSIWPHIERRLVDLVAEHRTTLVFTNSRRQAEKLTARMNEEWAQRHGVDLPDGTAPATALPSMAGQARGAGAALARAHHGSVSKEQRAQIEDALKAGELPAVVATSSLELGIDMGAVDLVVQVEAPPSVSAGLQRIGRAGHQVGAVSRGVVLPKHRGDLLTSAVVAEQMQQRRIEAIHPPRNPLDVLAQQVVAMVAMDDWPVDRLFDLVRRAAPFATLPERAFHAVLDMLAGRYPADDFATLRPRLHWDRAADVLSTRQGSQRVAVTSGGTIPDRGLYGVYLVAADERGGMRVGELDEEMVYESRVGDVFALGASSWRIEDITPDRVLVSPAPGRPGKLPFWHGDTVGRPYEFGAAVGAFTRELLGGPDRRGRLSAAGLDQWATDNLLRYLDDQRAATGTVPDDRTIVVERFRDEIGDWRIVWHSPFGARVHTPWALLIGRALAEEFGVDAQVMATDDGIMARLPDTGDTDLLARLVTGSFPAPEGVGEAVAAEVGGSALYASRFRECAARALLLPRRDPRRRSPLWQQRQRSAALLAVAARYPTFPITLEAMRECLQDVYDIPALTGLLADVANGRVRVVEVETPRPSPFAQSLLWSYVATYLYEGDSPLAERRAAALALDPELLASLLGDAQLRDLLDAQAIAEVEEDLQLRSARTRPRDLDAAADAFRLLGPLTRAEADDRGIDLEALVAARRIFPTRLRGRDVWAAVEDAGRLRDACGAPLPPGLPTVLLEPVDDPVGDLVGRFARTHGPFPASRAAAGLGLGVAVVEAALRQLARRNRVVAGEFQPGGTGTEWCDAEVLRRIRRLSAARLQRTIEPVPQAALARFLPAWSQVAAVGGTASLRGPDGVYAVIERLAGYPLPASAWERWVLPGRVAGYQPHQLDELTLAGEVVWWGAAPLPGGDGWVAFAPADLAPALRAGSTLPDLPDDPLVAAVVERFDAGGAWFLPPLQLQLAASFPSLTTGQLLQTLWALVWAGRLTNDSFAPVRALQGARTGGTAVRRGRRPGAAVPPAGAGRWAAPPPPSEATAAAAAVLDRLVARHGLVVRGSLAGEALPGGFSAAYRGLAALAEVGRVARMYVVDGLGGAQFAAPGVVDRLRALAAEPPSQDAVVLAATDPANPYGAALAWPATTSDTDGSHRPGRKAGAVVVLVDGRLVLYLERGGRSLLSFPPSAGLPAAAAALAAGLRRSGATRTVLQRIDGQAALNGDGPVLEALLGAGFSRTPTGIRLPLQPPAA